MPAPASLTQKEIKVIRLSKADMFRLLLDSINNPPAWATSANLDIIEVDPEDGSLIKIQFVEMNV